MTQEFHISVTPVGNDEYLVRTEKVEPGVPLAEEQVVWPVREWLAQAQQLMDDPLLGLLQGHPTRIGGHPLSSDSVKASSAQPGSLISLIDLGQRLYAELFQGTLRDSWMTAQGIAHHRGEVLRLRLGLKGRQLPRIPWEVLHMGDREQAAQQNGIAAIPRPIATGTDIAFSRHRPGIKMANLNLPAGLDQPLRILMAIAAPDDQEQLALKQEAEHLQQELLQAHLHHDPSPEALPDLQVTILEQPGREELTQALEQGRYRVLHYAGHSDLSSDGGSLYLVNRKTGLTETLSGDDLAGLLVNNGIQMAVFNSCRGADTAVAESTAEPERSLAEALVNRGIPAVLAMAERIPDDVALTLTRLFYRNLKQGYPIDLSLSRARQGLISAYGSDQLYWALPILYLHPEFQGYLTANHSQDSIGADFSDSLSTFARENEFAADVVNAFGYDAATWSSALGEDASPDLENDEAWMEALEYEDDLGLEDIFEDEDEIGYEEDAFLVSDLIQQLSGPSSTEDEDIVPASHEEVLLPDAGRSGLEIYHNIPDDPRDQPSAAASQPASEQGAQAARHDDPAPAQPVGLSHRFFAVEQELRSLFHQAKKPNAFLPIVLIAGVGAIACLSFWVAEGRLVSTNPTPEDLLGGSELFNRLPDEASETDTDADIDLSTTDTETVTAIAIARFSQNQLEAGEEAVEALLDRNALPQAEAALRAVPTEQIDVPAISFLRGRLAWQSVQTGNPNYAVDDARRYWETAVAEQPNVPLYHNALGFAYYADGELVEATEAWLQALDLIETRQDATLKSSDPNLGSQQTAVFLPEELLTGTDALDAYAGIALVMMKTAENQPPEQQSSLLGKAAKLYQMVIATNPTAFQLNALAQNWMWSEAALQDWQEISEATP